MPCCDDAGDKDRKLNQNAIDDTPRLGQAEALERLARHMYERLEHLDSCDDRGWFELSGREQDLYRNVVRNLVDRKSLIIEMWEQF